MTTILEKFNLAPVVPFIPKGLPAHSYVLESSEIVGIEVEVENSGANHQIPRGSPWNQEADGSLRNNGIEYVSRPIPASFVPGALQQLLTGVLDQDCHFSPRTSVHVHINAQDMQTHQVHDLVMVYSIFEKLLYKFAGRGRIRNIFCVPLVETQMLTHMVESGIGHNWSKYTGLNLCPLFEGKSGRTPYGTLEFRHMHGTFSVDKLCLWVEMITSLKQFILKSSTKDIRNMIISMDDSFDFEGLMHQVFGKTSQVFKFSGLEDVKDGYLAVKSAMTSGKNVTRIGSAATREAPFYKFKG